MEGVRYLSVDDGRCSNLKDDEYGDDRIEDDNVDFLASDDIYLRE